MRISGGLQLNSEFFAQHGCGTGQGREGQAGVRRVEQAVERSMASMHLPGHCGFGEVLRFHFLVYLPGDYTLDGHRRCFVQHGLFIQKIIEAAANVFGFIIHSSFCLLPISDRALVLPEIF